MDVEGNIYELTEDDRDQLKSQLKPETIELMEDVARLDGFLKGRAEAVKLGGDYKKGRLIHDSSKGTYRKADMSGDPMGIDGIEELRAQGDPGDEQADVTSPSDPDPGFLPPPGNPPETPGTPEEASPGIAEPTE